MKEENARVLLQIREEENRHWSVYLNTLLGFQIAIQVGIWSYFLKEFITAYSCTKFDLAYSYFVVAAAISSIALGVWRVYARYIENHCTQLYADILDYEHQLDIPSDLGMSRFLSDNIPGLDKKLEGQCHFQRVDEVRKLAKRKQLISRWSKYWSIVFVLAILIVFALAVTVGHWPGFAKLQGFPSYNVPYLIYSLIIIFIGLLLAVYACCGFKRKSSKQ